MLRFVIEDEISKLIWSPDDKFIMCVSLKTQRVHLRTMTEEVIEAEI